MQKITAEHAREHIVKNCPFCKAKGSLRMDIAEDAFGKNYRVNCSYKKGGCGACGGFDTTVQGAIDKWDMRSHSEDNNPRLNGAIGWLNQLEEQVRALNDETNAKAQKFGMQFRELRQRIKEIENADK